MKYLIKLTPLEPYFFGGENTFRIAGASSLISESYYISSLPLPSQTTILGMLRYVLLEQNYLLNTDRVYEDRSKQNKLIGEKAYMVDADNRLGKIRSVSPLFIMDNKGEKYIPAPLNHDAVHSFYSPLEMSDTVISTSHGSIHVPKDYDIKSHGRFLGETSYMRISDKAIVSDIFESCERVGIDKNKKDEAYFKKLYMYLKKEYCFAVAAELDTKISDTVCYMGREKSCFKLNAEPLCDSYDITKEIEEVCGDGVWYAFSDLLLKKHIKYTDYSIVKTGTLRTLSSSYDSNILKIRPNENLYNVIKAGSVFYFDVASEDYFYNDTYGLNKLVKLGG